MKKLLYFYGILCILFISQITFAQTATFYQYGWSQDGSRLIVLARNDTTMIATVYDDQWQPLASRQIPCCSTSLSPDGKSLLVGGAPAEILDTDTLQTIRELPLPVGAFWSRDGSEFVTINYGPPGEMRIYSAADGRLLREFITPNSAIASWAHAGLVGSSNGAYFAAGSYNQLVLLDSITGQQVGDNYQFDGNIISYSWSPDSTRIAISLLAYVPEGTVGSFPAPGFPGQYQLNSIVLLELDTGTITTLRSGFQYPVYLLMWSPDDRYIVTNLDGNVYTMDSANGNLIESLNVTPNFSIIGWSPDGARLLTGLYNSAPYEPTIYITPESPAALRTTFVQNQLDGQIQIFTPAATPERFAEIAASCDAPATLTRAANSVQTEDTQARTLLTQLDALPADTLSPSCAADLRLMAEALASEQDIMPTTTP
jgi:WD40 repeat protein